jgi:hypothetical protein
LCKSFAPGRARTERGQRGHRSWYGTTLGRGERRTDWFGSDDLAALPVALACDADAAHESSAAGRRDDDVRLDACAPDVGDLTCTLDDRRPLALKDVDVIEGRDEVDEPAGTSDL